MGGLRGLCFLPTLASRQLGVCPGTSPSQGPDTCVPLPLHIHTWPELCEGGS